VVYRPRDWALQPVIGWSMLAAGSLATEREMRARLPSTLWTAREHTSNGDWESSAFFNTSIMHHFPGLFQGCGVFFLKTIQARSWTQYLYKPVHSASTSKIYNILYIYKFIIYIDIQYLATWYKNITNNVLKSARLTQTAFSVLTTSYQNRFKWLKDTVQNVTQLMLTVHFL